MLTSKIEKNIETPMGKVRASLVPAVQAAALDPAGGYG
jgi:hypothetical protein